MPRVLTCFGSRSFSVAAPTIWNSLPFDIQQRPSVANSKRFFFQPLAIASALPHPSASDSEFLADIVRFINVFTYLFTYLQIVSK